MFKEVLSTNQATFSKMVEEKWLMECALTKPKEEYGHS